jgi:hypothetical protein
LLFGRSSASYCCLVWLKPCLWVTSHTGANQMVMPHGYQARSSAGCGKTSNVSLSHCFPTPGTRQQNPQYHSGSSSNRSSCYQAYGGQGNKRIPWDPDGITLSPGEKYDKTCMRWQLRQ